ncbi:uncharacterized protein F54H12.2-like [Bemisia tabaci]
MEVEGNSGLTKRRGFCQRSKTVEMMGRIHCDIFSQDKMLLNNVDLKLRFVRSRDDFCLLGQDGYKVKVIEANLFARRVRVSPSVLLSHAQGLEKTNAKYPITRADVKTNTIPAGVRSASLDNVVSGQLPTRIIMGMVLNTAFNGGIEKNPFNFQTFNLNYASFHTDGQQIPGVVLTPNFDAHEYVRTFHSLFSGTGIHYSDSGNEINREEFKAGYSLIALDFTPDLEAHIKTHWSLVRHGSLRIELRFSDALAEATTVITYAEFDNVIEIDKSRNVITDYSA